MGLFAFNRARRAALEAEQAAEVVPQDDAPSTDNGGESDATDAPAEAVAEAPAEAEPATEAPADDASALRKPGRPRKAE